MTNESKDKFYEFCRKIKTLSDLGNSRECIVDVINKARLPLSMHLCVMGCYSEIIKHGRPLTKREKLAGIM